MLPQAIDKENFMGFVVGLLTDNFVAGPMAKGDKFVFGQIEKYSDLRMDYTITLLPPKKYFFPQWDTLIRFRLDKGVTVEPVVNSQPQIILGAHPCDIYATWLLDHVFSDKHADPNYLDRRKRAVIIGLDCLKPCDEYQFCLDMGSLYPETGYDLFLTPIGDAYFVDIGTERGEALLKQSTHTRPATNTDFSKRLTALEGKKSAFRHRLPAEAKYLPDILADAYDSLFWEALARRCFSCGSCNIVCPTCYCFNVLDELQLNLTEGERKRHWDSCQLDSFAEVAGGENFRKERSSRLRHRFFRKGKYLREAFGKSGCVGCGRCDRSCVAKINSVETYSQIAGKQVASPAEMGAKR